MARAKPQWHSQVAWRDLVAYRHNEIWLELSLPLPWLLIAWWSAAQAFYPLTMFAAFYFFLTGLRVTHNAFHYALGLPRSVTDGVMLLLSVLMLGAHHAIQVTHMRHHRFCLQPDDIEGHIARQNFAAVFLHGLTFPWRIHRAGWHYATARQRRWIQVELAANVAWLSFIWLAQIHFLQVFSVFMLIAYGFSGFFAVWTVHHDCPENEWNQARTVRSAWKNALCYQMFFHSEHHLYPQVPTCHIGELAKRLDAAGFQEHKLVF